MNVPAPETPPADAQDVRAEMDHIHQQIDALWAVIGDDREEER